MFSHEILSCSFVLPSFRIYVTFTRCCCTRVSVSHVKAMYSARDRLFGLEPANESVRESTRNSCRSYSSLIALFA